MCIGNTRRGRRCCFHQRNALCLLAECVTCIPRHVEKISTTSPFFSSSHPKKNVRINAGKTCIFLLSQYKATMFIPRQPAIQPTCKFILFLTRFCLLFLCDNPTMKELFIVKIFLRNCPYGIMN
jgi:hypothetical protein